ncbi:MAG: NAD(P)/FAD-dependent oxidoreductase [Oscillospiraceae bacterium]|jgi:flavin-dependent dehydrogenase|nr:NAD(P)/FAD-dependent oxidoreductase [Oscillospiraceae bacterium]
MNILVAGAGHGGLVAAGLLARQGAQVTVVERGREETLGHDWTDIFNLASFREAGIPMPEPGQFHPACSMTFFNPSCTAGFASYVPPEECTESTMERREILRRLVAFAREGGARLRFETEVAGPIVENNRVAGLAVRNPAQVQDLTADLVIDAAGMNSPVRRQLPHHFGIVREFRRDQYFTAFRAFYQHTGARPLGDPFSVYFFPLKRQAVSWIAREGEYVDLMCGSFVNTSQNYAEEVRQSLLPRHPEMGDQILRGGQVRNIPVRRPISLMVANGYAAVGDAAGMTVPIIGAGICNSIRAGRLLAETIQKNPLTDFSVAELWPYQVNYMRQYGAVHASLDVLKGFLLALKPASLDYIFEHKLLEDGDLIKARTGQEMRFSLPELAVRGVRGASRAPILQSMAAKLAASQLLKYHALAIPSRYEPNAVRVWGKIYDGIK